MQILMKFTLFCVHLDLSNNLTETHIMKNSNAILYRCVVSCFVPYMLVQIYTPAYFSLYIFSDVCSGSFLTKDFVLQLCVHMLVAMFSF